MRTVYLDHAATTPLLPEVLDAMRPFFLDRFGNASSVHGEGRRARRGLEESRELIAKMIGANPAELFFTSGGTESDNLALLGGARAGARRGKRRILTTRAEHHAVFDSCRFLAGEGYDVIFLPVSPGGAVEPGEIREAVTEGTALVSVMHSNNEVGTITDLGEIALLVHGAGGYLHTDAVQSLGKVPVNAGELGVDLMTISAHKLHGPKGIGALYVRTGTDIEPLLHGGGQEGGRRPGTENVALAVGFAKAVELACARMQSESDRLATLRDLLGRRIMEEFPDVLVNGDPSSRLPHILSVSFDSTRRALEGETLVLNMDLEGVAVSSGSACTSGSVQPSHVLLAMGRDAATARATLRFSLGLATTEEDLDLALKALRESVVRAARRA